MTNTPPSWTATSMNVYDWLTWLRTFYRTYEPRIAAKMTPAELERLADAKVDLVRDRLLALIAQHDASGLLPPQTDPLARLTALQLLQLEAERLVKTGMLPDHDPGGEEMPLTLGSFGPNVTVLQ